MPSCKVYLLNGKVFLKPHTKGHARCFALYHSGHGVGNNGRGSFVLQGLLCMFAALAK